MISDLGGSRLLCSNRGSSLNGSKDYRIRSSLSYRPTDMYGSMYGNMNEQEGKAGQAAKDARFLRAIRTNGLASQLVAPLGGEGRGEERRHRGRLGSGCGGRTGSRWSRWRRNRSRREGADHEGQVDKVRQSLAAASNVHHDRSGVDREGVDSEDLHTVGADDERLGRQRGKVACGRIARKLIDSAVVPTDENPVSVSRDGHHIALRGSSAGAVGGTRCDAAISGRASRLDDGALGVEPKNVHVIAVRWHLVVSERL